VVHPEVVRANLERELPFLASEHLMMDAVKAGADRQAVHEALRLASREAAQALHEGRENPMRDLIRAHPAFRTVAGRLEELLEPARFVGRAPEQVLEFVRAEVDPLLERHAGLAAAEASVRV